MKLLRVPIHVIVVLEVLIFHLFQLFLRELVLPVGFNRLDVRQCFLHSVVVYEDLNTFNPALDVALVAIEDW